jgi:signal transduction histidine kinase
MAERADATLIERARDGLSQPVSKLYAAAHHLAARPEPSLQPFAKHIETASRELQQFVAGAGLPQRSSGSSTAPEEHAGAARARLLVADDNDRNREVLCHQLERQGYSVTAVANGREALRLLRERPFDLVLLDVLMPELDGFAALESIKADRLLQEIPVIMISASDEYSSVIRCIEGGAEDYLPKPFDPVLLRARLKASLEKKALRDQQQAKTEELERAYLDLQKMQDQLITQEKLASLGSLTAGIAHEIKNPLNFITNFAALSAELIEELRETIPAGADGDAKDILDDLFANVQKIEEHGHRADRIVRGMLSHARKQSGDREPADLNALVTECVNLAYHGLRSKDMSFNAAVTFDLDAAAPKLNVFPQDLSRVFLNIATNAFHAVEERRRKGEPGYQPALFVSTRALPACVEIRIRDNGMGIPEDLRKKIFEPFFTTKPSGAGTGLGLSISHDVVVNEHHGELAVTSESGAFTEFLVRLPREAQ